MFLRLLRYTMTNRPSDYDDYTRDCYKRIAADVGVRRLQHGVNRGQLGTYYLLQEQCTGRGKRLSEVKCKDDGLDRCVEIRH